MEKERSNFAPPLDMDKPQLEAFLTTLDHWALFFTAFVVVGVAGELFTHLWYSRTNERLLALQHIEEKQLQTQIAQANERTAELTRENLEIRRKMADRFLTDDERRTIVEGLSPYGGHRIGVVTMAESEPKDYGNSIISAIEEAHWAVQRVHVVAYGPGATPRGLTCKVSRNPDEAVQALKTAFQDAGITLKSEVVETQQDSFIELTVGIKDLN